jgi:hypothetical protein
MARINTKKLIAFKATRTHGRADAWCFCYFESVPKVVFTFENPNFIDRLQGFHIETLLKEDTEITVGVKEPAERILAVTSEGNHIVLERSGQIEVPAEIANRFSMLLEEELSDKADNPPAD